MGVVRFYFSSLSFFICLFVRSFFFQSFCVYAFFLHCLYLYLLGVLKTSLTLLLLFSLHFCLLKLCLLTAKSKPTAALVVCRAHYFTIRLVCLLCLFCGWIFANANRKYHCLSWDRRIWSSFQSDKTRVGIFCEENKEKKCKRASDKQIFLNMCLHFALTLFSFRLAHNNALIKGVKCFSYCFFFVIVLSLLHLLPFYHLSLIYAHTIPYNLQCLFNVHFVAYKCHLQTKSLTSVLTQLNYFAVSIISSYHLSSQPIVFIYP